MIKHDNILVGRHSFCDFKYIQEAIHYVETHFSKSNKQITLYILEGKYEEQIMIKQSNINLLGIGEVVITNNAYAFQKDEDGGNIGTFETATLLLDGKNVHLENLTVENTAGQGEKIGQAIALYANCDKSTFINCRIKGHQDTLFLSPLPEEQKDGSPFSTNRPIHSMYRQHYYQCSIEGNVDFIFGGATAYFDQCLIINKARDKGGEPGYITAACTSKEQKYGFIFNECFIVTEKTTGPVYLGRPWRPYAKVRFQRCNMDQSIDFNRWDDWGNIKNRETVTFEEYQTYQEYAPEFISSHWATYSQAEKILSAEHVFHKDLDTVREEGKAWFEKQKRL